MEAFIGTILPWAPNFAPQGWLMCDGRLLKVAEHQVLFSLIGAMYGGDGRTTFGLPDLRGRSPIGVSNHIAQGQVAYGSDQTRTTNLQVAQANDDGEMPPVATVSTPPVAPMLGVNFIICESGIYPSRG